jgi:hypothetical protein
VARLERHHHHHDLGSNKMSDKSTPAYGDSLREARENAKMGGAAVEHRLQGELLNLPGWVSEQAARNQQKT